MSSDIALFLAAKILYYNILCKNKEISWIKLMFNVNFISFPIAFLVPGHFTPHV